MNRVRSWVYFARAGDSIKVGLIGNEESEAMWHRAFAHLRTTGEWFKADPGLLASIGLALHHHRLEFEELLEVEQGYQSATDALKAMRALIHSVAESEIRFFEEYRRKPGSEERATGKAKADAFRLERAIARGEPEHGAPDPRCTP